MTTTGPPGPALACPGCGSPDVDLRRGLLCGTCAQPDPLVMPADEHWTPEEIAGFKARLEAALANPGPLRVLDSREPLGRLVRETWVAWAREQPDPKPSWLTGWDELDGGQREVDMRIGHAVANYALTENAVTWGTSCTSCARVLDSAYAETVRREAAEAKLAEARELARQLTTATHPTIGGTFAASIGHKFLAITGTGEENDDA